MDRFEHRRKRPFRIEIRRRSDADRTDHCGSEIGKNVSKKIRRNYHIEPFGMTNKVRSQDVNMELVGANVGIFFADFVKTFIPKGHGVNDAVRFGGGCDVLLALPSKFKSILQDTAHAATCEERLLDGHLLVG